MDISNQVQNSNNIFIPLQDQSSLPQPIVQASLLQNQIVMNQMAQPKVIYVDATNIKSNPCNIICPFCNKEIMTQINKKCNWYSCVFCYCIGLLPWITLQFCRNKTPNCFDADHFCPHCGNKIAEYNSC